MIQLLHLLFKIQKKLCHLQAGRDGVEISNSSNTQSPGFNQTLPAILFKVSCRGNLGEKAVRLLVQPAGAQLSTTVGFNKISTSASLTHFLFLSANNMHDKHSAPVLYLSHHFYAFHSAFFCRLLLE